MVNFTILAGGFTTFIAAYVFDSDAGTLSLTKQNPTGQNPSWIASHPQNSSILYAVNEIGPVGNLQSFTVDEAGGLTLVDTVSTGGNGPTFTNPLSTGEISAMNFGSPNSSFIPTDPTDPTRFVQDSPIVSFPVDGGPSNPHQSLEFNGEIFVPDLGADKIWRIAKDEPDGAFKVQGQIDVAPGSGPRHIAIRDNILFILNEKASTLTAQPIPEAPNGTTLPLIANVSIVPPPPSDVTAFNGSFFAAEIVISEPTEAFPQPLIYVSNRNLGPDFDERGDSIAIFEFTGFNATSTTTTVDPSDVGPVIATLVPVNTGPLPAEPAPANAKRMIKRHARSRRNHELQLERRADYAYGYDSSPASGAGSGATITLVPAPAPTTSSPETGDATPTDTNPTGQLVLVNQVFTGLRQIRSFTIGKQEDGSDEFLIAGANLDGGVAVFRRVDEGRNLELVARNTELQSRTSFVFL